MNHAGGSLRAAREFTASDAGHAKMKTDLIISRSRTVLSRGAAYRYSAVELLGALLLLLAVLPFVDELSHGDLVEVALMSVVMIFAVLAIRGSRRMLVVASLILVPALAARWANHVRPDLVPREIFLSASILFFVFVIAHLLRFILHAPRVDGNVLCAAVSGYLLLGLLWVPAYLLVARVSPAAFALKTGMPAGHALAGFDALYFSFITLCTVGYGDVSPLSKAARMLAVLEAIAGLFYMAVLISRLVAIHASSTSTRT